jgi:hypothetical protein
MEGFARGGAGLRLVGRGCWLTGKTSGWLDPSPKWRRKLKKRTKVLFDPATATVIGDSDLATAILTAWC